MLFGVFAAASWIRSIAACGRPRRKSSNASRICMRLSLGARAAPAVRKRNAAVYALQGRGLTALDELERAYAAGWRDGRTLAIDPYFTSVRSEPRFTQLLSRIESDVAAMRARADYSGLP